jgi:zinc D-Ala-D-Ala carboxypeptidase
MIYLSPHFTLDEFTVSETAERLGLSNDPPLEIVAAMKHTAMGLEGARMRLGGAPILISSGYRSPAVNKAVGGSANSQHMTGQAVDFIAPRFGTPRQIVDALADSDVPYDQCILEFNRWVHLSFSDKPRRQALVIDRTGTRPLLA